MISSFFRTSTSNYNGWHSRKSGSFMELSYLEDETDFTKDMSYQCRDWLYQSAICRRRDLTNLLRICYKSDYQQKDGSGLESWGNHRKTKCSASSSNRIERLESINRGTLKQKTLGHKLDEADWVWLLAKPNSVRSEEEHINSMDPRHSYRIWPVDFWALNRLPLVTVAVHDICSLASVLIARFSWPNG